MPTTQECLTTRLCLQITIIIRIKLLRISLNTNYTGRQSRFLYLRGHRLGIAGREHIHIAVVCRPNGLVVLRTVTSASITDLIRLYQFRVLEFLVRINSDPSLVRILRPLQFPFFVSATTASSGFSLYQLRVFNIFTSLRFHAVLTQSHRDSRGIDPAVRLENTR